ncbi:MAG: cysteine desulfurase [Anaerolineae bacterium]|nr:cysteine desulfurase [Anaerolineae bacterium]
MPVYLDHSASTPTDPRVLEAMLPYFGDVYGNGSSAHSFGRKAEQAIEDARDSIARVFGCQPGEIVFTSGGTESDNLAVRGAAWARRGQGKHLITSPVEHPAVLKTTAQLAGVMGFERTVLPVDNMGMVNVEDFVGSIRPETTVASIVYANNEVGTVNPIPQLAAQARERGVLFHTDAVQAAGQLPLDVNALGVDMLSISAHKFYGPKGVGALYVRSGIELESSQTGGGHENDRRAGTLNTPGIVGMAKALELAYAERDERTAHYRALRDQLIDGVLSRVPGAQLTGHPSQRLPSHASFVFDGIDGNTLLMHLDMKGIAASSASACKTGNPEPSDVLLAMGYPRDLALSSLRLTVGMQTTDADIEFVVDGVAQAVEKLRRLTNMQNV